MLVNTRETNDEDRRSYQSLDFTILEIWVVFFEMVVGGETTQRNGQYNWYTVENLDVK